MRKVGLCLSAIAVGATLAFAGMSWAPTISRAAETPPPFCEETELHDYLKPLDAMKPLHAPPANGVLGFGPRWLQFDMSPNSLITDAGNLRVSFMESETGPPPSHTSRRIDWKILTTFAKVDARGRTVRGLFSKRTRIRYLAHQDHPEQFVAAPRTPGFYRLFVSFRDAEDRRLGSFGSYVRVATPTDHATLGLSAASYRPGEPVLGRVENFGTAAALFGAEYSIERFDGTAWSRIPESPHIFPAIAYWAAPGMTGSRCSTFEIPPTMSPGHYRMTKRIDFARNHRFEGPGIKTELHAEFDIAP